MLSLALIIGIWTTSCIQTSLGGMQGYVQETYQIEQNGEYTFTRDWFSDPICEVALDKDVEEGSIKVGKKVSGMFSNGETYEANFKTTLGEDLGVVQVGSRGLKFGRGMKNSTFRNTMPGLFDYKKQ